MVLHHTQEICLARKTIRDLTTDCHSIFIFPYSLSPPNACKFLQYPEYFIGSHVSYYSLCFSYYFSVSPSIGLILQDSVSGPLYFSTISLWVTVMTGIPLFSHSTLGSFQSQVFFVFFFNSYFKHVSFFCLYDKLKEPKK